MALRHRPTDSGALEKEKLTFLNRNLKPMRMEISAALQHYGRVVMDLEQLLASYEKDNNLIAFCANAHIEHEGTAIMKMDNVYYRYGGITLLVDLNDTIAEYFELLEMKEQETNDIVIPSRTVVDAVRAPEAAEESETPSYRNVNNVRKRKINYVVEEIKFELFDNYHLIGKEESIAVALDILSRVPPGRWKHDPGLQRPKVKS